MPSIGKSNIEPVFLHNSHAWRTAPAATRWGSPPRVFTLLTEQQSLALVFLLVDRLTKRIQDLIDRALLGLVQVEDPVGDKAAEDEDAADDGGELDGFARAAVDEVADEGERDRE